LPQRWVITAQGEKNEIIYIYVVTHDDAADQGMDAGYRARIYAVLPTYTYQSYSAVEIHIDLTV